LFHAHGRVFALLPMVGSAGADYRETGIGQSNSSLVPQIKATERGKRSGSTSDQRIFLLVVRIGSRSAANVSFLRRGGASIRWTLWQISRPENRTNNSACFALQPHHVALAQTLIWKLLPRARA